MQDDRPPTIAPTAPKANVKTTASLSGQIVQSPLLCVAVCCSVLHIYIHIDIYIYICIYMYIYMNVYTESKRQDRCVVDGTDYAISIALHCSVL